MVVSANTFNLCTCFPLSLALNKMDIHFDLMGMRI